MSVLKSLSLLAIVVATLSASSLHADLVLSDPNSYSTVTSATGVVPLVSPNGQAWTNISGIGVYIDVPISQSPLGTQYNLSSLLSVPASGSASDRVVLRFDAAGSVLSIISLDGRGVFSANTVSKFPPPELTSGFFTLDVMLNQRQFDGSWLHSSKVRLGGTEVLGSFQQASTSNPITSIPVTVFGEGTSSFSNLQLTGITAVPEPSSLTFFGLLSATFFLRRRYLARLSKIRERRTKNCSQVLDRPLWLALSQRLALAEFGRSS
jgi:hypothetical protein